jgi:hypothetical protein
MKSMSSRLLLIASVALLAFGTASSMAAIIYVDFSPGTASPTAPDTTTWNNMVTQNTSISLLDTTGAATGITLANVGFSNVGTSGVSGMTGTAAAVFGGANGNASVDFFASNADAFGTAIITLSGLNLSNTYLITVFGSRATTGSRISEYRVGNGVATETLSLEAINNTANVAAFAAIAPSVGGSITLDVRRQTAGDQFAYVNAVKIEIVPEPSTVALMLGGLGSLVAFRRRRA